MATIKTYTDLKQSKKLAEILPTESADMCWCLATKGDSKAVFNEGYNKYGDFELPCWSLAVLISILPDEIKHDGIVNNLWITSEDVSYYSKEYDSYLYCEEGCTVDACVEMILKLHEKNLL